MALHESKLNVPPRLDISSVRIDKIEGISKSKEGGRRPTWLRFSNSSKGYVPS